MASCRFTEINILYSENDKLSLHGTRTICRYVGCPATETSSTLLLPDLNDARPRPAITRPAGRRPETTKYTRGATLSPLHLPPPSHVTLGGPATEQAGERSGGIRSRPLGADCRTRGGGASSCSSARSLRLCVYKVRLAVGRRATLRETARPTPSRLSSLIPRPPVYVCVYGSVLLSRLRQVYDEPNRRPSSDPVNKCPLVPCGAKPDTGHHNLSR